MAMFTVQVFLPIDYYPGEDGVVQKVEEEKFKKTMEDIALTISGGGFLRESPESIHGIWTDKEETFWDDIKIIEFDVEDTKSTRRKIIKYVRDVLLNRFGQIAIYVRFIPNIEGFIVRIDSDIDEFKLIERR